MSGLSLNSRSSALSVPSLALSFTRNDLARRDSFLQTCQVLCHLSNVALHFCSFSLNPPVLFLFFRLHFDIISSGSLPFPSTLRLNLQILSLRHLALYPHLSTCTLSYTFALISAPFTNVQQQKQMQWTSECAHCLAFPVPPLTAVLYGPCRDGWQDGWWNDCAC